MVELSTDRATFAQVKEVIPTEAGDRQLPEWGSQFEVYCKYAPFRDGDYKKNEISISSGSFDPTESLDRVWKFQTAGEVVANWNKVCEIVNTYCARYREMVEAFYRDQQ